MLVAVCVCGGGGWWLLGNSNGFAKVVLTVFFTDGVREELGVGLGQEVCIIVFA